MSGLQRALFRIIPITTLVIAILTGLSYILIYGENTIYDYTFLEQTTINGNTYQIFNWQNYINAFDITNFNEIFQELDFTFLNNLDNHFSWDSVINALKSIVNALIILVDMVIWTINLMIFMTEMIGMILYYAFTLLGFNMNTEIAWESFPLGAMVNFIINLPNIEYVPFLEF